MAPIATLIEHGEVYAPAPTGARSLLIMNGVIARVGDVDRRALAALGLDVDVIDARGCVVTPGLIDPHEHLIGGSGERGFASRTPEVFLRELVAAGITTVVGALGVDTTTRTPADLLAKVKALRAEDLSAFMWSGGYDVPPVTLTRSVRDDMLLVDEVIGAGEIAIADRRSSQPSIAELARIVADASVGGLLTGKAGVTHFHVGDGPARLAPLRALVDEHDVDPSRLYPTHVERSEALFREAVDFARRGACIDVDTVEEDLPRWVGSWREHGGDPSRLTVSSDAGITSPANVLAGLRACVRELRLPLEYVLPFATTNPARVLRLDRKGMLAPGKDGDVLVLRADSLALTHVVARGHCLMRDGAVVVSEAFRNGSNREVHVDAPQQR